MKIDRAKFLHAVQHGPLHGPLSDTQTGGITAILDTWDGGELDDLRWLAYMFATVLAECGKNMVPVREGFKKTDADARAYVRGRGYPYAKQVNGQVYYGRGLVQLTWDYNYKAMGDLLKRDLVTDPDVALEPDIAAAIMFKGMTLGKFTRHKLGDYFNAHLTDWVHARRIINGLDRADEIAGYAKQFHTHLVAAAVSDSVVAAVASAPRPAA